MLTEAKTLLVKKKGRSRNPTGEEEHAHQGR